MAKPKIKETKDEFESKLLDLARVVRVMAGGRRFRFRAVMAVGNRKGKIGIGIAKGKDVSIAIEKATRQAKKNIIAINIKNKSIPFETSAKYKAAKVLLKPAPRGKGIVAGGAVRIICELAGIENIIAKVLSRTTNKINTSRATIRAFKKYGSVTSNKTKN